MAVFQRGLSEFQEQDPGLLIRDTRTLGQRFCDFVKSPTNTAVALIMFAVGAFMLPAVADLIFLTGIGLFSYSYFSKSTLPFRLPRRAKALDYNDTKPGNNKPNKARGICYYGNDRKTNEELWFNNDDMRTHTLIFGSTGSGKTEALISLAYNALVMGSGFIYVDGKGDNTLFAKVFSMARRMGREDDLLVVNYMTGAKDIVGPQEARLSNTLNPFSVGSSSMLTQLVVSMMDSASGTPDGDMWKGRAIQFVEALMKVLVYARDKDLVLLDANTIRTYFTLDKLESIIIDKMLPRHDQEAASIAEAPQVVLDPLNMYMDNLPGFNPSNKGKQSSQVYEQHGFITMQLTRVFSSLADTYGHIMRTKLAEVDFKDIVLNRRILVVLLPALEKAPDELSNLGKVIVASLKAMMASGLGESVEGSHKDIIESKPTNAPTPYMCILDEYGYYAVEGFAVVPAQARSLGFSTIFAGQDLPAFQKVSKEEAASIGANTNIKIAMKLEDPVETWDFFAKTAGESYVTKVDAFQTDAQSVTNHYLDTRSASAEKRARIDLLDLKEQREGEAHIFFKSKIVRAKMFYANPKTVKYMHLNQFLKVEAPPDRQLIEMEKRGKQFEHVIKSGDLGYVDSGDAEDINIIAESIENNDFLDPIERGVAALIAFHNSTEGDNSAFEELIQEDDQYTTDEIHIFKDMAVNDALNDNIMTDDIESFAKALLSKAGTYKQVEYIERLNGKSTKHASNVAAEIVKDIQLSTHYPPQVVFDLSGAEVAETVDDVIEHLQSPANFNFDDFSFDDDDDD